MQSLRDGPLQSRLCLLHRVRQQLAASEPRRVKKWIREIVARAKRVPSMLSPSSSSRTNNMRSLGVTNPDGTHEMNNSTKSSPSADDSVTLRKSA
jgi:hypothetical protein